MALQEVVAEGKLDPKLGGSTVPLTDVTTGLRKKFVPVDSAIDHVRLGSLQLKPEIDWSQVAPRIVHPKPSHLGR